MARATNAKTRVGRAGRDHASSPSSGDSALCEVWATIAITVAQCARGAVAPEEGGFGVTINGAQTVAIHNALAWCFPAGRRTLHIPRGM